MTKVWPGREVCCVLPGPGYGFVPDARTTATTASRLILQAAMHIPYPAPDGNRPFWCSQVELTAAAHGAASWPWHMASWKLMSDVQCDSIPTRYNNSLGCSTCDLVVTRRNLLPPGLTESDTPGQAYGLPVLISGIRDAAQVHITKRPETAAF